MALAARSPKVPKFILYTFFILSIIKEFISQLLCTLGLNAFIDQYSDSSSDLPPLHDQTRQDESANIIRKMLPVVKFEDFVSAIVDNDECSSTRQDSCAVCLCEFENEDEIRPLMGCRHIFHGSCLDGWIDHDHSTCPLCRTPFIPIEMQRRFKESLNSHEESQIEAR